MTTMNGGDLSIWPPDVILDERSKDRILQGSFEMFAFHMSYTSGPYYVSYLVDGFL